MTPFSDTIWWHVYPLAACGAPTQLAGAEPAPRLRRLEQWLDYVVDLGCTGILLGPIFESTSHGYDTLDFFRIDPRLGTEEDFRSFADAAHARGLRIMADGVFNHVGREYAGAGGQEILKLVDGEPQPWEGTAELLELDHDNPQVADLVVDVIDYWTTRGVDAWRLDVAYAVPSEFWATVTDRARALHPDVAFSGEVLHGDFAEIARAGHLDTVTAYEVWKAIWSSIKDTNMWELAWALDRHAEFSAQRPLQTFVGNHDVTRVASQVGEVGAALAAIILFSLPGIPSIYYGDEQGLVGEKGEGFDADLPLRPELPATPPLADAHWLHPLHQELTALRNQNRWLIRGLVEVTDKTNETISYTVTGEGHELRAEIDAAEGTATLHIDGTEALAWSRSA